jgi:hypothetical protein
MFSKFFTFSLIALIAFVFSVMSFGQSFPFFDDFETYTVGGQLVCQDSVNWTTWNDNPCDANQDPYISDNYAYSGTNSVVIVQDNDLVKPIGPQTAGKWDISFRFYIPAGKDGYFNCMSSFFVPPGFWALQVAFNNDGSGICADGSGPPPTPFTYSQDEWILARVVVDLDSDSAEFSLAGEIIYTWQWTIGNGPLQLDVVDFYGDVPTFEMYVDNFSVDQILSSVENEDMPGEYALHQNYPNPFNPSTKIKYSIPQNSNVIIKVFDILGNEIETLIDEEKPAGGYLIEFVASDLPSGIYFYKLQAVSPSAGSGQSFVETKKMILLK